MLKISRESEINLINVLIDNDIISGKDLVNIKKVSSEKNSSQIDAVFELKLTNEQNILDVLVKEQNLETVDLTKEYNKQENIDRREKEATIAELQRDHREGNLWPIWIE